MSKNNLIICVVTIILFIIVTALPAATPKQQLGKLLYFDENLSTPTGQSCATCHAPGAGFADPDSRLPVSDGVLPNRFGNRNSPSAAYAKFSPRFHFDSGEGVYVGGQFWDGRADDLIEQAKGPFLNPLEMNNPSKRIVVLKVKKSDYADLFEEVWGPGSLDDVDDAYNRIAESIAAFESSYRVSPFKSKFDYYLRGQVELTERELAGLELYEDPAKGNCAACHPSEKVGWRLPLFTDFTYDNLGIPKNPANPFYDLPYAFNPLGEGWIDYGLGAVLNDPAEDGKFKVPTLRNIFKTAPYGHNGFFKNLYDIVHFYNTRDVGNWPPPEVAANVNTDELGNLGLTVAEEKLIIIFLRTLNDGFRLSKQIADNEEVITVTNYSLSQNYPNPFNPVTTIRYSLENPEYVTLKIYDINGQLVQILTDSYCDANSYEVLWDGHNENGELVASGTYFYQINAGQFTETKKMTFLK